MSRRTTSGRFFFFPGLSLNASVETSLTFDDDDEEEGGGGGGGVGGGGGGVACLSGDDDAWTSFVDKSICFGIFGEGFPPLVLLISCAFQVIFGLNVQCINSNSSYRRSRSNRSRSAVESAAVCLPF